MPASAAGRKIGHTTLEANHGNRKCLYPVPDISRARRWCQEPEKIAMGCRDQVRAIASSCPTLGAWLQVCTRQALALDAHRLPASLARSHQHTAH